MDKFKKISYIILIIIIIILSLTIYTNASRNGDGELYDKTFAEVKFLESKFVDLFNTMNNITFQNYNISVSKETQKVGTSQGSSSQGSGESSSVGGGQSGGSSSGGESGESSSGEQGGGNSGGSSGGGSSGQQEEVKQFELKSEGVLTKEEDVNWDSLKNEVETLYSSLPSITLNLYQVNLNQEDVLGFNKEYDNLTLVVKDEKKQETLNQLSKLYDYLPKFMKNVKKQDVDEILLQTKAHIFKAYAKLESNDWQGIQNDVKNAIQTYNTVLSKTDIDNAKQYKINKCYVMINELQNAVSMQDETVFLIKYKNLLEELSNM